jgi:hypothetical protein
VYFYQVEAENRCGVVTEEGTLHITYWLWLQYTTIHVAENPAKLLHT